MREGRRAQRNGKGDDRKQMRGKRDEKKGKKGEEVSENEWRRGVRGKKRKRGDKGREKGEEERRSYIKAAPVIEMC